MASVYYLIIGDIVFQVLYNLDSLIKVMLSVTIDQFAYVLTLVWAFLNNLAIVLEQMINEESVKILSWALLILIDLASESLAEDQSINETTRDRLKFTE